jgi:hypothetical protein
LGLPFDAVVLAASIHGLGLPPTWARIPSFLCALTFTYFGDRFSPSPRESGRQPPIFSLFGSQRFFQCAQS